MPNPKPDLPEKRCAPGQIVADRGRGDTALPDGIADLVLAQRHLASRIKAGDVGALMRIDDQAALFG